MPVPPLPEPLADSPAVVQILPERQYTAPNDAVGVLLDAQGHTAPAGQGLASQSRAMSSLLDEALRGIDLGGTEHKAPSSGGALGSGLTES